MNLRNVASVALQRCIKVYNNSKLLISIYHNPVIYIRYTFYKIGRIVLIATLQRQRLQRILPIVEIPVIYLPDIRNLSPRLLTARFSLQNVYCFNLAIFATTRKKIFPTRGNFCALTW